MPTRIPSSLPKLGGSRGHKKAISQANAKVRRFFVEPSSPPRFTDRELETMSQSLESCICNLKVAVEIYKIPGSRKRLGEYRRLLAKLQREGKGEK